MSMGEREEGGELSTTSSAWNHQITLIFTEKWRASKTKNNGIFLLYGALYARHSRAIACNCWCDDVIFILFDKKKKKLVLSAFHSSGPFVNFYYFHAKRKLLWQPRTPTKSVQSKLRANLFRKSLSLFLHGVWPSAQYREVESLIWVESPASRRH